MQYLGVRSGNGQVVFPARFLERFRREGWTIKSAPTDLEPVTTPTPLTSCARVEHTAPEQDPPPAPKPKRTRTKRRTTKRLP